MKPAPLRVAGEPKGETQLRTALPWLALVPGLVAAAGATAQGVLGTGHFRPLALVLHLGLAGTGLYWLAHPPRRASRAAFGVSAYLSTLIGTFILESGDISSFANLAMVSIGAAFLISDRRYMVASQGVTLGWFVFTLTAPLVVPNRVQAMLVAGMLSSVAVLIGLLRARMSRAEAASERTMPRELVHDVNNLLGGILGGADLALASEQHPEDLRFALNQIRDRTLATRDFLRDVTGRADASSEPIDVNEVVSRVVALAHGLRSPVRKVVVDLEPDLPAIALQANDLERAVMNLITNAIDATREVGGEIRIRTRRRTVDGLDCEIVRVEDDGVGIPVEIRKRVFERGFSTRGAEHEGLGLAIVARVVATYGGRVAIDDSVVLGTAIELVFPLALVGVSGEHVD